MFEFIFVHIYWDGWGNWWFTLLAFDDRTYTQHSLFYIERWDGVWGFDALFYKGIRKLIDAYRSQGHG